MRSGDPERGHQPSQETEAPGGEQRRGNASPQYTVGEEIANSVTHGVGTLLSMAGLVALVVLSVLSGEGIRIASLTIYGISLVLLHLSSTLYHALTPVGAKRVFRVFDHASIFLLIAGSYTPFLLLGVGGALGWIMFGIIWGVAINGVVFKAFCTGRFGVVSTIAYILMGWMAVFVFGPLVSNLPLTAVLWLVGGGASYTLGIVFYAWKKLPYAHMIWHLFVLTGAACHYVAVVAYL
ncbi:hemolysin III family protein [Candidatus Bipolaricaulota bacterium]|nr:hemolysin III family protein [Candidatus Bipolaricaulota bacterium]